MTDDTKRPSDPHDSGDAAPGRDAAAPPRRTDDTSPSPGFESTDAGTLPAPPDSAAARPTPESQAALTGKAPSGSSTSGTTVPAASSIQAPPDETPEEKTARLKRVVEEAKARKAAREAGGEVPPPKPAPPRPAAKPAAETPPAPPATAGASSSPAAEPPGGASPSIGDPLKSPSLADLEKAAKIAEAKARAAAAKQAATDRPAAPTADKSGAPAAAAPKAPVKKKEEGPKPQDASDHPLVKRLREKLNDAVLEATTFLSQLSVRVAPERVVEVCRALRDDAETPFNYLSDLTCVHRPENFDAPFELVYNLYSISANERVRVKAWAGEDAGVESVTGVWPAANWMEREVFDLFGVRFKNHPDLRRLLLPPDWDGHPLRKDYPLEAMENDWTTRHLPEFTEVEREQLEQRRAYGLEILSSPYERRVREVFRAGKEVMPKELK